MTLRKNGLLALLSPAAEKQIKPFLITVTLETGAVLHEPFEPIEFVYFFESGLSSEVVTDSEGEKIEVGCIGKEGCSGLPAVLGVPSSPHKAFMEIGGPALKMRVTDLQQKMDEIAEFRTLLHRFVHIFMVQVSATALSDGRYDIHKRLARWILMAHDRVEGDELALTHEFLALMLGVRRSGVTNAIHVLEGEHMIRADRGLITVRDRPQLERLAKGCYGLAEAEYRRVLLDPLCRLSADNA
jgi:CRP-like cAMP-binding protein